jgi:hypothetical protein
MDGFAPLSMDFLNDSLEVKEGTNEKDPEEVLDFGKHVYFLSSIFNKLTPPIGNIFTKLYSRGID